MSTERASGAPHCPGALSLFLSQPPLRVDSESGRWGRGAYALTGRLVVVEGPLEGRSRRVGPD